LNVDLGTPTGFQVFVLEFAGTQSNWFAISGVSSGATATSSTLATAPIDATNGEPIVSMVVTCASLTGIDSSSPFTAVVGSGNADVAWFVPTMPGSYGAVWTSTGGTWDGASASFR
jgi:hypothetical protein